jgi:hypothetical protein
MTPRPKKFAQSPAAFARGGAGKMFSKQSAGPATPARTGKVQTPAPGAKSAKGGARTSGHALATPAKAGHTAPLRKGR